MNILLNIISRSKIKIQEKSTSVAWLGKERFWMTLLNTPALDRTIF